MKASIKNFFEPTPKHLKKLAWAIKAFCGSSSLTLIASGHQWIGIGVAILGAVSDFIIELFREEPTETEGAKQQFPEETK